MGTFGPIRVCTADPGPRRATGWPGRRRSITMRDRPTGVQRGAPGKAVVLYHSAPDVMAKAPIYYPAHRARVDAFHARGELLAVGTWADPREGSMAVFRTRAAAEEFTRDDPFVVNGVVARYEIKDWN